VVNLHYFAKHFQGKLEKNFLFTVEETLKILQKRKEERITIHQTNSSNVRQLQVSTALAFIKAQNTLKPFNWKVQTTQSRKFKLHSPLSQKLLVARIMMHWENESTIVQNLKVVMHRVVCN
jgi:outer membrane biogenesis lipoprotein LolB